ncbi:MAG: hypothetical protein HPY81_10060 [Firmicutes bacterium]|nr:hypothetical protein [Bacillota bacterium]
MAPNLPAFEYEAMLHGSPEFQNHVFWHDWTDRFCSFISIPNLILGPDGAMYVTKNTATRFTDGWNFATYSDRQCGTLKKRRPELASIIDGYPLTDRNGKVTGWHQPSYVNNVRAVYRIYPDGRQEMLDEGTVPLIPPEGVEHISWWFTPNRYIAPLIRDGYAVRDDYVVPTDNPDVVLATSGCWLWQYNVKTFEYKRIQPVPGNEWPTGNRTVFAPDEHFTPTKPRLTKTLGVFFAGTGTFWRLYNGQYYQDLGGLGAGYDSIADYSVDEDNRLIYVLTKNGQLLRVDFSDVLPKMEIKQTGEAISTQHPHPFRVRYERNNFAMYGTDEKYAMPYNKGGSLYVPVDAVMQAMNLWAFVAKDIPPDATSTQIINTIQTKIDADIVRYPDGKVVYYVPIDKLLAKVYEITGQKFTWSYDAPSNILYINCAPGAIPLFD